jgi:glycosyltransferase involved in cell wall biosynthesis
MKFFILCKNEAQNIKKCIESLLDCGMTVVVLDSGSTDDTLEIISKYPVEVVDYEYTNHCDAYNKITSTERDSVCGVFDADMEMTPALAREIQEMSRDYEVLACPVKMYVEGMPLTRGSLCPPKPIVFRGGRAYFEPVGHGERLVNGLNMAQTMHSVIHNDLKSFSSYLQSQVRYSKRLVTMAFADQLTWRDRLRTRTPLFVFISPLYSLLVRGGLWSKLGWLYAMDRLIAESIMYRNSLRKQVLGEDEKD